ncbi:uncharacterized protein LOC134767360 [Penaeus indicus]|uniref:uncharacterized protein LOC134767360 n=1 Tax=Penaeus indicus TaxID=29960 RepID=UPI00300C025E
MACAARRFIVSLGSRLPFNTVLTPPPVNTTYQKTPPPANNHHLPTPPPTNTTTCQQPPPANNHHLPTTTTYQQPPPTNTTTCQQPPPTNTCQQPTTNEAFSPSGSVCQHDRHPQPCVYILLLASVSPHQQAIYVLNATVGAPLFLRFQWRKLLSG